MTFFPLSALFKRFEPVGPPLSVHLYFYDDRFQGYLVRQEVRTVESKDRETLELWAMPQATLVFETNLKEFERLKNLEVRIHSFSINNILTKTSLKVGSVFKCYDILLI